MPTQQVYRRALAYALGDLEVVTVTASTNAQFSANGLVNSTGSASVNRYNGAYLYPLARRVQTGGYTPSTGTLLYTFTSGVAAVGSEIEITRLFPGIALDGAVGGDTSYETLLNKVLAKLLVPDRVSVAVTTSNLISLATWGAWLDRPDRLIRVLEPPPVGSRPIDASWRGINLVLDGGTPGLELAAPFLTATGNLTVEVLRPAFTLISGAESTTGLTTNTQTAIAQTEDVVVLGLLEAYQELMSRSPGQAGGQYEAKFKDAQERAEQLMWFDNGFYKPASMRPQQAATGAAA